MPAGALGSAGALVAATVASTFVVGVAAGFIASGGCVAVACVTTAGVAQALSSMLPAKSNPRIISDLSLIQFSFLF